MSIATGSMRYSTVRDETEGIVAAGLVTAGLVTVGLVTVGLVEEVKQKLKQKHTIFTPKKFEKIFAMLLPSTVYPSILSVSPQKID